MPGDTYNGNEGGQLSNHGYHQTLACDYTTKNQKVVKNTLVISYG